MNANTQQHKALNLNISVLRESYKQGSISPENVMARLRQKSEEFKDHNIWIHLLSEQEQAPFLTALADKNPEECALWGIPFAIKDNIDLAGIATTAGCEAFAYTPKQSARVVQQLIDAGAIPVGKTNLDQFATGLNGTRSSWGACKNAFNPEYISGGSSSGSAVALALGLVSFSLGTDTAGSGRVPACFNNLIGLKPSRGLLSNTGLVPACRSLDCMTVFALDIDDANAVLNVAEGVDLADGYSRKNPFLNTSRHYGQQAGPIKMGIIPEADLKFFGDVHYEAAYRKTLDELAEQGVEFIDINYALFDEAAKLLYEGPWVAERFLAIEKIMTENPEAVFPVVRDIIAPGGKPRATALFSAQYRLTALKQQCDLEMAKVDCLLTPTAGRCFTIEEMLAEPILRNSQLGYYTNFMNLLDYASVAVPTQISRNGLPFGITFVGPAFTDRALLSIAKRFQQHFALKLGATDNSLSLNVNVPTVSRQDKIDVVVCGAHLEGFPLNWQLSERDAILKTKTKTAPLYRMYALAGGPPYRPGLILDKQQGRAIDVEVWSVPADQFGSFVAGIPAPLGVGKIHLADNTLQSGFICEPYGLEGAEDITYFGGWRGYMASLK